MRFHFEKVSKEYDKNLQWNLVLKNNVNIRLVLTIYY